MRTPKLNTPGARIAAVWAYVAIDPEGDEAVCCIQVEGTPVVLMTGDPDQVACYGEAAQEIARRLGYWVELRRFTVEAVPERVLSPVFAATPVAAVVPGSGSAN